MGDFNQRILDHEKIESFLTSESLITIFLLLLFQFSLGFYGIMIIGFYYFI